jgi:hypothetical protein
MSKKPELKSQNRLERSELAHLTSWFQRSNRKPLMLRGARQIGKTSIVRMLCSKLNLNLIEVNLEFEEKLRSTFLQMDPSKIIRDIEHHFQCEFNSNTLLFIDEIQAVPEAIQGLRYFYEKKPGLAVIAAGSLLEFVLSDHGFSMPVGRVEMFYMGPLKFSDYILARKKKSLHKLFLNYKLEDEMTTLEHQSLLELFFEYINVGGMPEAVHEFVQSNSFSSVRRIQKNIIQTYRDDFGKYSKKVPLERIDRIFQFSAVNLARKVKYSEIDPNEQSKSLILAIELLEKAGIIHRVFHSNASGIPLSLGKNGKIFKFLFMDVGLVSSFLNLDSIEIQKIYFNPPTDPILLHKGMMSEQFVGQLLHYRTHIEKTELFYWLRDESTQKAEVDFVIENGLSIIPVEVKGGKTGTIKSLIQFVKDHKSKSAIKLTTKPPNISVKAVDQANVTLVELPLYFAERIHELTATLRD